MKKSRKQNVDKCKIFDYLMKKRGYKSFKVYVRKYDENRFGLNAYDSENLTHTFHDGKCNGSWLTVSDFIVPKKYLSEWYNFRKFNLKSLPRELKEAVIDHCVGTGIFVFAGNKVFMPAINCLEELAIKVELEA